jgi:HlyD family secretion protein
MQKSLLEGIRKVPRSLLLLILAGVLGTGGFLAFRWLNPPQPSKNSGSMTVSVKTEELKIRIRASGTVTPVQAVNLSPKNSGRLAELLVDQGDRVHQGQVLARMEDSDIRAALAQSEATLNQVKARLLKARNGSRSEEIDRAQAEMDAIQVQLRLATQRTVRNRNLFEQGAISRDQLDAVLTDNEKVQADLRAAQKNLDQLRNGNRPEDIADAEATVAQAEAEVQAKQVQLQDTVIRAPFNGIITQKYASVGAFVTPTTSASSTSSATSTSIVAIAGELEILAKVPEQTIRQIHPGQAVTIQADAFPGKTFQGRVRLVAPEAVLEQNVTSFQVRVTLQSGQTELKSGMNVDLQFRGDRIQDAVVIPTVAIVSEKGQTGVLIADGDRKSKFQPITVGVSVGDRTQVLQGLNAGDQIVVYQPKSSDSKKSDSAPPVRFR